MELQMTSEVFHYRNKKIFHINLIGICWLAVIGFDLFLHAGLLAQLYQDNNPAILPPLDAFYRIPIAYIAFLFNISLVYFLIIKMDINDRKEIIKLVMIIGLFLSVSSTLAQFAPDLLQFTPFRAEFNRILWFFRWLVAA